MNFTLHQLRVFQVVVEQGSITRAAELLHMTQPAVSIQLKNLQAQFDLPLTEVVGRKLYITDFGRELYAIGERVLSEVDSIGYTSRQYRGMLTGKLRLSVASTGKYVMPYYLRDFLEQHPGVDLSMDVTNRSQVIQSLAGNEVDFSLVSLLPEALEVEQEILLPNHLYLVGPVQSPLPADRRSGKSVFRGLPVIFREEGSGTRIAMQRYFQKANLIPRVRLELTSNEAVKQAVMAGLGYSILSLLSLRNELRQKVIKILPMQGLPLRESWRLIWLRKKQLSPVARAFLQYVRENKEEVNKKNFGWVGEY
jgi:DNA-binding transcriptional LysR family regulator